MNTPIPDLWVLEPAHEYIDLQQPKQLAVHKLQADHSTPSGGAWHIQQTLEWLDFVGTPLALNSLGLPETKIILCLPSKNTQHSTYSPIAHWVCPKHDPLRLLIAPLHPWHTRLSQEIQTMQGKLHIALTDNWQQAPQEKAATALPWNQLTSLIRRFNTHAPWTSKDWLLLSLKSTIHPSQARQRLRVLGALLIGATALCTHFFIQNQQIQSEQALLKNLSQSTKTQNQQAQIIPWNDWSTHIQKLGLNERANVESLEFHWNGKLPIHTQLKLQSPRKRLPKGCSEITTTWIHCSPPDDKNHNSKSSKRGVK